MGDAADDYYDSLERQQWQDNRDDDEIDDWPDDCQMHHDGQCGAAGSEYCDFECPVMRAWRREPWDENGPIEDDAPAASPTDQVTEQEKPT
jgi:hypothetical protein